MPDETVEFDFTLPDDPQDVEPNFKTIPCSGTASLDDGTIVYPFAVKGKIYPWTDGLEPQIPDEPPFDEGTGAWEKGVADGEVDPATGAFRFGDDHYGLLIGTIASNNPSNDPQKNTVAVWGYFPPKDMMPEQRIRTGTKDFLGRYPAKRELPILTRMTTPTATPITTTQLSGSAKTTWYHYRNLDPRTVGIGTKLLFPNGAPLRAKYIRVYASKVDWKYGATEATRIHSALGNYEPATYQTGHPRWKYPHSPRYSINLTQPNGTVFPVQSEVREFSAAITLEPRFPVFVQLNEIDEYNAYLRHSGKYNISVCVVA